ncbi:MAG: PorT family protein [Ferruginibacter sp.]|uniref:porin family protein n=1 Tax=Ferruginibacter sp. TaxID=1940288 RepID=UPI002657AE49|nr:porin family protein [Ferruginibacter sp.]MDB5278581.1 PorT family protein [Ferruginibacter sp.]
MQSITIKKINYEKVNYSICDSNGNAVRKIVFSISRNRDRKERGCKKTAKTYFDLMINVVSTHLNYGSANSELADYKKTTNGIQAGASFLAGITPAFSLVSEFYYIRRGGKLKANNPLSGNETTLRLNTLELPVLARLHIGSLYVNAGPSIAYNLSGKNKIGELSNKLSFSNSSEGFKRFDASVQIGGGVEFPFKQKRIAVDIRYNYGLTNIAYGREIYNRGVMVSVFFSKAWKTNPLGKK